MPRPTLVKIRAFSLLELLVVVGIIGILLAVLLPQMERATEEGRLAACAANLHSIGTGLHSYAVENSGLIAAGPATPSAVDPTKPYAALGNNQVQAGVNPIGLGLLITNGQLSTPAALICPCDDDATARTAIGPALRAGTTAVFGSYAFRQLDQLSGQKLLAPGTNSLGQTATALAFDWQSTGPAPYTRASHDENERINLMSFDGSVQGFFQNGALLADPTSFSAMPGTYTQRLDQLWVNADTSTAVPAGRSLRAAATVP